MVLTSWLSPHRQVLERGSVAASAPPPQRGAAGGGFAGSPSPRRDGGTIGGPLTRHTWPYPCGFGLSGRPVGEASPPAKLCGTARPRPYAGAALRR